MNKVYAFGENDDGTFTAMIDGCSNSILTRLINPSIPFVWSVNHFLGDSCTWGLRDTNLSKGGPVHKILVRNLSFDFFMNTAEYLACLSEFERQGNILIQCTREIPQSLNYFGLAEEQRTRILVENGMYSVFFLPHEGETASFTCVDKPHVEAVIQELNGGNA